MAQHSSVPRTQTVREKLTLSRLHIIGVISPAQTLAIQHIFGHLIILDHQDCSNYISISPISTRRIQALENHSLSSPHRFSSERRAPLNLLWSVHLSPSVFCKSSSCKFSRDWVSPFDLLLLLLLLFQAVSHSSPSAFMHCFLVELDDSVVA
ncbi:uncharacterized protein PGTG_01290 [Puccinia graminis f. sp. tritici CRL 75-36-700-3]|uniref:Uncharacterized protein n=1 Tax=Puccinia graminis f. sp. tritici (strain CRL 75-36-700-3 / race SCCL) TaxID=418459 RepID=E3JV84_PUCGT|nr:uncharacterized protein PGTG_01290 [Puccinia graminis f. sp. tritici CRL 75-36-700-3]EFP75959.1 hypothetical protein PGTG_01290 [Puccinia graminis f. sp. tritici CRL 75-36-700-3]